MWQLSLFKEDLPLIRGRYAFDADLSALTWFRVGGKAQVLFKPEDAEDLACFLKNLSSEVPIIPIGVGSNLLVREGGVPGVVVRLGKGFSFIKVEGHRVHVGAGALDRTVALYAQAAAIEGLEFLAGIPGTIGGALRMNAGAYGSDFSNILVSLKAVDRQGKIHDLNRDEIEFSYRHCHLPADWIFLEAVIEGKPGKKEKIQERIEEIMAAREATQPVKSRTGGSTFKNPEGYKAWQLIDEAGCRGLRLNGAMVSELHCNFLINTGTATAADLEALGEKVREQVREKSGIALEWEIQRIGALKEERD